MAAIKDISIIVPCYNESLRIINSFPIIKSYFTEKLENYEVLFIDDGSSDKTFEVIQNLIYGWNEAQVIRLDQNKGKGAAIREGVLKANKKIISFMDADCSTELSTFEKFFPLISSEIPIIIGSRDIKGAKIERHQFFLREYLAKFFNLWIQVWALPGVWDTQCGFKFFLNPVAKKIFYPLIESGFGFDVEVLFRAKNLGYSILESPVVWSDVKNSRVNVIKDGLKMAVLVVKLRIHKKKYF